MFNIKFQVLTKSLMFEKSLGLGWISKLMCLKDMEVVS